MSVNSKMTALANEIRELSGTSAPLGLDAMIAHTGEVNNEVETQADLLEQIMTVLESKTGYNTIYIGSSVPTDDFGINGDIYVVRGGS